MTRTRTSLVGVLMLAAGFAAGSVLPGSWSVAKNTPVGDPGEADTLWLLGQCEARTRLLRVRHLELEQERESLRLEQRISESTVVNSAQRQRWTEREAELAAKAAATAAEVAEMLALGDRLRALLRSEGESAQPKPEWVREAHVRLRVQELAEHR